MEYAEIKISFIKARFNKRAILVIKNVLFLLSAFFFLLSGLTGCETVRKKFTRPPKKPKEQRHIVLPTKEYGVAFSRDISYNNYFIFWKCWHQELIDCLGTTNRKKELECAEQISGNLEKMHSLLAEEKAKELEVYLKEVNKTISQIKEGNLSEPKIYYLKRELEQEKRNIDRQFLLSKVKKWIRQ